MFFLFFTVVFCVFDEKTSVSVEGYCKFDKSVI